MFRSTNLCMCVVNQQLRSSSVHLRPRRETANAISSHRDRRRRDLRTSPSTRMSSSTTGVVAPTSQCTAATAAPHITTPTATMPISYAQLLGNYAHDMRAFFRKQIADDNAQYAYLHEYHKKLMLQNQRPHHQVEAAENASHLYGTPRNEFSERLVQNFCRRRGRITGRYLLTVFLLVFFWFDDWMCHWEAEDIRAKLRSLRDEQHLKSVDLSSSSL